MPNCFITYLQFLTWQNCLFINSLIMNKDIVWAEKVEPCALQSLSLVLHLQEFITDIDDDQNSNSLNQKMIKF